MVSMTLNVQSGIQWLRGLQCWTNQIPGRRVPSQIQKTQTQRTIRGNDNASSDESAAERPRKKSRKQRSESAESSSDQTDEETPKKSHHAAKTKSDQSDENEPTKSHKKTYESKSDERNSDQSEKETLKKLRKTAKKYGYEIRKSAKTGSDESSEEKPKKSHKSAKSDSDESSEETSKKLHKSAKSDSDASSGETPKRSHKSAKSDSDESSEETSKKLHKRKHESKSAKRNHDQSEEETPTKVRKSAKTKSDESDETPSKESHKKKYESKVAKRSSEKSDDETPSKSDSSVTTGNDQGGEETPKESHKSAKRESDESSSELPKKSHKKISESKATEENAKRKWSDIDKAKRKSTRRESEETESDESDQVNDDGDSRGQKSEIRNSEADSAVDREDSEAQSRTVRQSHSTTADAEEMKPDKYGKLSDAEEVAESWEPDNPGGDDPNDAPAARAKSVKRQMARNHVSEDVAEGNVPDAPSQIPPKLKLEDSKLSKDDLSRAMKVPVKESKADISLRNRAFDSADQDKSGFLEAKELKTVQQKTKLRHVEVFDEDGDGKLSRYEFHRLSNVLHVTNFFAEYDKDRDSHLNMNEASAMADRQGKGENLMKWRGYDEDKDRKLSFKEYINAAEDGHLPIFTHPKERHHDE